jgi:uncharacterized membrane protein
LGSSFWERATFILAIVISITILWGIWVKIHHSIVYSAIYYSVIFIPLIGWVINKTLGWGNVIRVLLDKFRKAKTGNKYIVGSDVNSGHRTSL